MPLLDFLGSIMDATHPTQANPYYGAQQVTPDQYSASAPPGAKVPTTNIWLDAHGNDITDHMKGLSSDQINQMTSTPYQAPNFWARLGRNGKEIANLNAQAQDLLGQQMQQRSNARTISSKDWATLGPILQSFLGNNPEQAKTLLGNDFRGQNIEGVGQFLSDINSGLPGLRTASNVASANAQIPLANNQAAIQKRLASNGYPTTEADNQSIGALNSLTQGIGENSLIPKRLSLQDLQLSGANAAQPNLNKEIYNNAAVGAGTSEQNVNDLPSAIQYLHNRALLSTGTSGQDVQNMPLTNLASGANAITGAYESLHPNAPYNPMAAQVDPSTGTITPGRNLQNTITGQVAGQIGGGTGPVSHTSSGTSFIKPPAPLNPLAMQGLTPIPSTNPGNDYSTDYSGKLYRGGIPIEDPDEEPIGHDSSKPQTIGQRLLSHIPTYVQSGMANPHSRAAQLSASHAIQQHQQDAARIQELTSILTNPPTKLTGRGGTRVSSYTSEQLKDMADELDKLTGNK